MSDTSRLCYVVGLNESINLPEDGRVRVRVGPSDRDVIDIGLFQDGELMVSAPKYGNIVIAPKTSNLVIIRLEDHKHNVSA